MQVIIDFDGALTAEETQAQPLAEKSLNTLANEIVGSPGRGGTAALRICLSHLAAGET